MSIGRCRVSWLDIALGIIGALVGGFLFDLFGASGVGGLNMAQSNKTLAEEYKTAFRISANYHALSATKGSVAMAKLSVLHPTALTDRSCN